MVDDETILDSLCNNQRVNSYPLLADFAEGIKSRYEEYRMAKGNAHQVVKSELPANIKKFLKSHYSQPPKELAHIDTIRDKSAHRVCCMCGSMHSGTLDHLLPQEDYSDFAIFSLNLVPACKCNSLRGSRLLGTGDAERILHPYFDECMGDRLVVAKFEDLGSLPRISLELCIDESHPNYAAVKFHVECVVERTAIKKYILELKWVQFIRKPSVQIRSLKRNPASLEELRDLIQEELDLVDEAHMGKNNWDSIFVAGLLHQDVLVWLFDRFNQQDRVEDGPLCPQ